MQQARMKQAGKTECEGGDQEVRANARPLLICSEETLRSPSVGEEAALILRRFGKESGRDRVYNKVGT